MTAFIEVSKRQRTLEQDIQAQQSILSQKHETQTLDICYLAFFGVVGQETRNSHISFVTALFKVGAGRRTPEQDIQDQQSILSQKHEAKL